MAIQQTDAAVRPTHPRDCDCARCWYQGKPRHDVAIHVPSDELVGNAAGAQTLQFTVGEDWNDD